MSILGKQWILSEQGLSALIATSLDDETVCFHDPFLFRDMEKAVTRLGHAIDVRERIVVFGDYDVDGISGTALLVETLRELGGEVSYRLPDRQTGYGLQPATIEECQRVGVSVLITVDCGISNAQEIEQAYKAGIDVIVTDHHTLPENLPTHAHALIHASLPEQNYPFQSLSGSAVAFKLAVALMHHRRSPQEAEAWARRTVDLASLGTVADCMPLLGENRWITKRGLEQMRVTEWEGLRALLRVAGIEEIQGYDSDVIGFRIGPRLNAAGRLDSPYYALQLLLNENGKAAQLAAKLESMNEARRTLMDRCLTEAEAQRGEGTLILVGSRNWPAGIIGLIAGKLAEKYHRPTIVFEDRGGESVASCRSIPGFSIVDLLAHAKEHLKTFGGHAAAAGFTIVNEAWDDFRAKANAYVEERLSASALQPTLRIDGALAPEEITTELVAQLEARAPFGEANPRPRFMLTDIQIGGLKRVGQTHKHLKLELKTQGRTLSGIAFNWGEHLERFQYAAERGEPIQAVVELSQREWQGRTRLEVQWVDATFKNPSSV